jgi:hypothetical protein
MCVPRVLFFKAESPSGEEAIFMASTRLWAALSKLHSSFHVGRVVSAAVQVDGPGNLPVRVAFIVHRSLLPHSV